MTSFTDSQGRTWVLTVNVDAIRRVRQLTDVDLLEVVGGKLLEQLAEDPVLLCDVLFALCKPEADAKQVSDEDFGRAMAGDTIEQATTALLEALADFFPGRKGELLKQAAAKLDQLQARVLDHAGERLTSGELETQIEAMLAQPTESVPGSLSTLPGASSASTPGP
jgi:hypothetical protein